MRIAVPLSPFLILGRLREDGSAATLNRLGKSQHVADLRLMFSATIYVVVIGIACAIVFGYWHVVSDNWQREIAASHGAWVWVRLFGDSVVTIAPFVGTLIALGCAVIGWAYQSGSARLGIVDLFACEIGTICRICAITDVAHRYVEAFDADLGANGSADLKAIARIRRAFSHFDANENYTPVFDHNAADLRVLDVKVVTNVTAFYTYFKAMRDTLRNMTRIDAPSAAGDAHDPWHEALKNVIYMMFLTFESARKAVRDLIEFDPNQVENTINILINELCAYQFLIKQFDAKSGAATEDFRYARLRLRFAPYRDIVGRAYWSAIEGKRIWTEYAAKQRNAIPISGNESRSESVRRCRRRAALAAELAGHWTKAAETAHELEKRYKDLFPGEKVERPIDLSVPNPDMLEL